MNLSPKVSKKVVDNDWLTLFEVGNGPGVNVEQHRVRILNWVRKELKTRGFSLADVATLINEKNEEIDVVKLDELDAVLREV